MTEPFCDFNEEMTWDIRPRKYKEGVGFTWNPVVNAKEYVVLLGRKKTRMREYGRTTKTKFYQRLSSIALDTKIYIQIKAVDDYNCENNSYLAGNYIKV